MSPVFGSVTRGRRAGAAGLWRLELRIRAAWMRPGSAAPSLDLDVMLEQPCPTLLDDCAAVRAATGLPMKIDENAHDTGVNASRP